MGLRATLSVAVTLVSSWHVLNVSADRKISLVSFPVNITEWKKQLQDKLSHPVNSLRLKLKKYVNSAHNGNLSCVEEGGECTAQFGNCCSDSEDLECLPSDDSGDYICRKPQSSEDLAQQRLNSLQYGDSKGIMSSHPWVDSWEFQSKSTMERDEEKAAADAEFTKNFKPKQGDNVWKKVYNNLKSGGKNLWNDIKNLEKLRKIKNDLIEKYIKNNQSNELPPNVEEVTTPEIAADEATETTSRSPKHIRYPDSISDDSWLYPMYPSDTSGSTKYGRSEEETFNRFPHKKPRKKKNKKIEFRIEDIIEDVTNLLSKKLKEKVASQKCSGNRDRLSSSGVQEPFHHNDIMDSAERLKTEINELKALKEKQTKSRKGNKADELSSNDELIRKHVAAILDEERKLDKLKKLEVFKKLQEG